MKQIIWFQAGLCLGAMAFGAHTASPMGGDPLKGDSPGRSFALILGAPGVFSGSEPDDPWEADLWMMITVLNAPCIFHPVSMSWKGPRNQPWVPSRFTLCQQAKTTKEDSTWTTSTQPPSPTRARKSQRRSRQANPRTRLSREDMAALIISSRGGTFDREELTAELWLIEHESGFNPRCRTGNHYGLFQLSGETSSDPKVQENNIRYYLATHCGGRYHGSFVEAARYWKAHSRYYRHDWHGGTY